MLRYWTAWEEYDAGPFLQDIAAATLVVHRTEAPSGIDFLSPARALAATIPNAQLTQLPYERGASFESPRVARLIDNFLGIAPHGSRAGGTAPMDMAVILFADIADSTALTERLGDAAFREKARALDEALRRAISSNGGTAIEGKLLGDGVLATFGAAREAIACARELHKLSLQRSPPRVGDGLGEGSVLLLHVGIHAGDVIHEDDNVYGGAVNIAARVAGEAAAGETLVSGTVRDLARTSAGVSFEDRGERELKGVSEPVRVWAVRSAS
jgi:class 3 adenylate cyclase